MNGYTGHRAADAAARVCVCVLLLIDGQKDNAPRALLLLIGDRCKTDFLRFRSGRDDFRSRCAPATGCWLLSSTSAAALACGSAHLTSRCGKRRLRGVLAQTPYTFPWTRFNKRSLARLTPILDKYTNYCAGGTVLETKERNVSSCKRNKTRLGFLLFRETARTRLPRWLRFPLTLRR